jgi:nitrate reductase NapE
MDADTSERTSRRELYAFLFLTVVLAPVITVGVVGGYGFIVWMLQLLAGPPGPS